MNVCLGSRKQGFCLNVAENFSPEIYVNRLLIVDFPDSIVKFCLHSKIVISTPRNFVTHQITFYHHLYRVGIFVLFRIFGDIVFSSVEKKWFEKWKRNGNVRLKLFSSKGKVAFKGELSTEHPDGKYFPPQQWWCFRRVRNKV